MRFFFCIALLFIASSAFAQPPVVPQGPPPVPMDEVYVNADADAQQELNAVNAMLTAQRARIENLQLSVETLTAKVDALARAQNVQFSSRSDWAGDATWSVASPSYMRSSSMYQSSYSAGYMMQSQPRMSRQGVFSRLRLGAGRCSS